MRTISLDIEANGFTDALNTYVDALQAEVEAQAHDHWDAIMREQLAKVFAVLEMAVEFAHVNDL